MKRHKLIGKTKLSGNEVCKVHYNRANETIELDVDGTTIRFGTKQFFIMNEMMRKAVARLVMQTKLRHVA